MSMKKPWYPRFPDHFIAGTMHLTIEQRYAYSMIVDLIHASDNKILRDDDRRISRVLGFQERRWRRVKNELQMLKKLQLNEDNIGKYYSFNEHIMLVSSSQPIEKVRSTANKRSRIEENIEREKKSISSSSSLSQSAGARAGEMEAPATPAPSEKKEGLQPMCKTEEERSAFVEKILGRKVLPGRAERPELHHLPKED
jgi:uncharacterized protein YdaU (DUF1376 family)